MFIQGLYFDGNSSNAQQISVEINAEKLYFSTPINNRYEISLNQCFFEFINDLVKITFKDSEDDFIEINNPEFRVFLAQYLKSKGRLSIYQQLIDLGWKIHTLIALGFLGLIALFYVFVLPEIAEQTVNILPENVDTELGNKFYGIYNEHVDIDSNKSKQLNLFAQNLKLNNTKKIHFTVVKSDMVNAFALPNGEIVVYTGILKQLKDYKELVALIGHEVSHVNKRHSIKMLCRNLAGLMVISVIFNDINGIAAVIGDNINQFESMSYSRKFESQADQLGLEMMESNKINGQGMVMLLDRINKLDTLLNIKGLELFSSHPKTLVRIKEIQKLLNKQPKHFKENAILRGIFIKIKNA